MSPLLSRLWPVPALVMAAAASGAPAAAQTALPEITVTAPSPIRAPTARTVLTVTPVPAAPQLQGALPIVTDQFATVTMIDRDELRRAPGATLGDLLMSKPGITGSGFAPGAASRPIVRGLDVNRVGIVENGGGGGGVSDLGEDHFVPLDPLSADRIEVIRGPATLRYGSQAIGGVVSATNNRIPEMLPCPPELAARGCASVETRGGWSSGDNGRDGAILLDAGRDRFAIHADAFGRRTDDYRVPSYPYLTAPDPADMPRATQPGGFTGRQPNSAARTDGHSIGGSYLFDDGHLGLSIAQNNARYGIPGPEGENRNTRIDARQTKISTKGEWRGPVSFVDAVRLWTGLTDYKHHEIGLDDPLDLGGTGIRQSFTNKEIEGRLEVQLAPLNLRLATMTAALGAQAGRQNLTASSPDNPGSALNGLWDPNRNSRIAGYVFNEFAVGDSTKAQLAGRIEQINLSGSSPSFPGNTFDSLADPASIGAISPRELRFTPKSGSVGAIQHLPWNLVASLTGQYVERAPKPAELFSRGPHDATGTFDIGNANLGIETARSVEIGLRRAAGSFRFEATAYRTEFQGFIYRRLTGNSCHTTACVDAADPAGPLELKQAAYSQADAIFRGAEFQSQLDVAPVWRGWWGIENQFDVVRARFADGSNVPRIPPLRAGGGLFYRDSNWLARINLLHAFAQNDVAPVGETATLGYNLLKAELSYTKNLKNDPTGISQFTVGLSGNNLLNDNIRNHVSYTKDVVLMPGASVKLFAHLKFGP